MKYVKIETAKKLTEIELKNIKTTLSMFSNVLKTLEKFDGKQINKRIETALKKNVDDRINVYSRFNSFIIECNFFENRGFKTNDGTWAYLNDYTVLICHCCLESSYNDGVMNNQGNFDYKIAKTQIEKYKEYLIKQVEKTEKQLFEINSLLNKYCEIIDEMKKFNNEISPIIKNHFVLNTIDSYNITIFE